MSPLYSQLRAKSVSPSSSHVTVHPLIVTEYFHLLQNMSNRCRMFIIPSYATFSTCFGDLALRSPRTYVGCMSVYAILDFKLFFKNRTTCVKITFTKIFLIVREEQFQAGQPCISQNTSISAQSVRLTATMVSVQNHLVHQEL